MDLDETLGNMHALYMTDPDKAVRGQGFINILHGYLGSQLHARLRPRALKAGIKVIPEAHILGSHKPKNVDVAVVDPHNGPLIMVGLRSQISSVGKNALTYYESIIGECISLQDRFPMAVIGYVYLMPLTPIKAGAEKQVIDHGRYARMYEAITNRTGPAYKDIRGVYDQFAYMVVGFSHTPPAVRDDLVSAAVPSTDLTIGTFVDRTVETFVNRHLFLDLFE